MNRRIALLTVLLGTPVAALANPVSCELGSLTRSVEVVYSDPGQPVPCEVIYDKSGEGSIETLWRANHEAGYCEDKAAALVGKLEGLGWRCDSGSGQSEEAIPEAMSSEPAPDPRPADS